MTIRCFLAFPISGKLKEKFKHILHELQDTRADVKWVKSENIHLTLKFLGDIEESKLENISSVVRDCCRGFGPVTPYLTELGAFPDMHHPKIWWGALDDSKKGIEGIVEVLERELAKLGIAKEDHPFKPHITIGRMRSSAKLKDVIHVIRQITFEDTTEEIFDKIVLYKSTLTPQGPIYEVVTEMLLYSSG